MEVDAFLILVLSVHVAPVLGWWVLGDRARPLRPAARRRAGRCRGCGPGPAAAAGARSSRRSRASSSRWPRADVLPAAVATLGRRCRASRCSLASFGTEVVAWLAPAPAGDAGRRAPGDLAGLAAQGRRRAPTSSLPAGCRDRAEKRPLRWRRGRRRAPSAARSRSPRPARVGRPRRSGGPTSAGPDAARAWSCMPVEGIRPRRRPPRAAAARPHGGSPSSSGLVLGLLLVVRILDAAFLATLYRPFNPLIDWRYVGSATDLLGDSVGPRRRAVLAVVAAVGCSSLGLLVLTPLAVRRLGAARRPPPHAARCAPWRPPAGVWSLCAVARGPASPRTCRSASSSARSAVATHEVTSVRDGLHDRAGLRRADPRRPVPRHPASRPADRPAGQGRRSSSSSRATAGSPSTAEPGRRARPRWTPARAGWAPPATPPAARASPRPRSAGSAGWPTRRCSPGSGSTASSATTSCSHGVSAPGPHPGAAFHGPAGAPSTSSRPTARTGPRDRPSTATTRSTTPATSATPGRASATPPMPDQYTLSAFDRLELEHRPTSPRQPVMAEIDLVSSHAPWAPLPQLVDWAGIGDGSVFPARPDGDAPRTSCGASPARVRAAYGQSVAYSLDSLVSFLPSHPRRQPRPPRARATTSPSASSPATDASHDVPVSAHRPRPGRARPDRRVGLAGRPAAGPGRAGVADGRVSGTASSRPTAGARAAEPVDTGVRLQGRGSNTATSPGRRGATRKTGALS